jgi:hypothetical protein
MFDGGFIIGEQGIWVQSQKGNPREKLLLFFAYFFIFTCSGKG